MAPNNTNKANYIQLTTPSTVQRLNLTESSALLNPPNFDVGNKERKLSILPAPFTIFIGIFSFVCFLSIEITFFNPNRNILSSSSPSLILPTPSVSERSDRFPFETVTRVNLQPSLMWGKIQAPFPTGSWWSNLVVGEGDQLIVSFPYQFKIDHFDLELLNKYNGGLQISYGSIRREANEKALIDWFDIDLCIGIHNHKLLFHDIERYDPLTVDVNYYTSLPIRNNEHINQHIPFQTHLARGSPFVTTEFYQSIPEIRSIHSIQSFEKVNLSLFHHKIANHCLVYRVRYQIKTLSSSSSSSSSDGFIQSNDMVWLLFFIPDQFNELSQLNTLMISDEDGGRTLRLKDTFTGLLRAALVPRTLNDDNSGEEILITHSGVVPTGGSISWDLNPSPVIADLTSTSTLDSFTPGSNITISLPSIASSSATSTTLPSTSTTATATSTTSSVYPPISKSTLETGSLMHDQDDDVLMSILSTSKLDSLTDNNELDRLMNGYERNQGETVQDSAEEATYSFHWETRNYYNDDREKEEDDAGSGDGGGLLSMLLPHHVNTLGFINQRDGLMSSLVYSTIKGPGVCVVGNHWHFREPLTSINFFASNDIKNEKRFNEIPDNYISELNKALQIDFSAEPSGTNPSGGLLDPKWVDPYGFGKAIARIARLALIAEESGNETLTNKALASLKESLEPWYRGENSDRFVYDATWGGIVTKNGVETQEADFGNGWYNDHHFHYGYFLYASAVLIRSNNSLLEDASFELAIESLLRDIGHPGMSGFSNQKHPEKEEEENTKEKSPKEWFRRLKGSNMFPFTRHQDWYDGHSWASGLFPMNNGKSQESVSEAINAYYSIHLLGKAVGDETLSKWGRLLLAKEMRAAHWYWQMGKDWSPYPAIFSQSKMAGVIGSSDTKVWTWFGSNPEFVHGINMMPFTPITQELLGRSFIVEEFPILEPRLDQVSDQWKGLIELARAVNDPEAAFESVLPLAANRIDGFDAGNSLSNSLYWIITRPALMTSS